MTDDAFAQLALETEGQLREFKEACDENDRDFSSEVADMVFDVSGES